MTNKYNILCWLICGMWDLSAKFEKGAIASSENPHQEGYLVGTNHLPRMGVI
ncbi:hypothetical protein [Nostoc sp. UHCC 0252]|uniref:hypothetical protein n=1 Tax=Nostoc sp. UHCC 0252 TaxID=3110241 RepID=UPI002B214516|nr:hypothetical protein [Nostoc sp. UHCC 0252]MEA5603134.1 hypothetical protein [Nostoc sp. UHCC 0252]